VRTGTVVISLLIHAGVAFALLTRAETKARHKAISVAVPDEVKKKPAPPKPPPPPPRPVAHVTPKVAPKPEAPEPVKASAPKAAPVQTAVALSNADLAPGGIAMAGTPKLEKAAPVKVAAVEPGAPRKRLHEPGAPNQAEEVCDEEPTKPVPLARTEVEYTAEARANNVEGHLVVTITVGADGAVTDVTIVNSVDPALDAAAVATIKTWRFKPALKCGKPVAGGIYKYGHRFELAD
jgi:protein TonB